jgi:hypothetical protein
MNERYTSLRKVPAKIRLNSEIRISAFNFLVQGMPAQMAIILLLLNGLLLELLVARRSIS